VLGGIHAAVGRYGQQTGNASILLTNIGTPAARGRAKYAASCAASSVIQRSWSCHGSPGIRFFYGLVLPVRAPKSARAYQRIWMSEGSPHAVTTERLRLALARELESRRPGRTA